MAERMCYFSSFWVEEKKKKKTFPELRRKAGHGPLQSITLITYSANIRVISSSEYPPGSLQLTSAARQVPTFEPLLGVFERLSELP